MNLPQEAAMQTQRPSPNLLVLTCASLASLAAAQTPQHAQAACDAPHTKFAAPVRLQAGDKLLGKGRLYPSPAAHDINGDGRFDIVVGDLRGHLTYALQQQDGTFGDEQKLKATDGKVLDFGNW